MASHASLRPAAVSSPVEETPAPERVTLTPHEMAFLDSEPTYEQEAETVPAPSSTLRPAPIAPLATRRIGSLLVFTLVVGSASLVLGLAALRGVGHALLH